MVNLSPAASGFGKDHREARIFIFFFLNECQALPIRGNALHPQGRKQSKGITREPFTRTTNVVVAFPVRLAFFSMVVSSS